MMKLPATTEIIQCHNEVSNFNYDIVVDWAIEMLEMKIETDSILILASFSKPVPSQEIRNYVDDALAELHLENLTGDKAIQMQIKFWLDQILQNNNIRDQLYYLYKFANQTNYSYGLLPFYCIYHGWNQIEELGTNDYSDGQTLKEIQDELIEEVHKWLNEYLKKQSS